MAHVRDLWHKKGPAGELQRTSYYGKGKRWQARYEGADGKTYTKLFAKKVDAEDEVSKQRTAVRAGDWLDPKAGKVTVGKFALEVWLPSRDICSRTQIEYRGILNRYLIPEWGTRQIRTIRPSQAAAWQALLTSKYELTGSTPNRVARHVRSVFRLAVIDKAIRISPFAEITAPTLVTTKVRPPDISEVRQLIEHAYHDRWAVMAEFTALTGLRSGELRGLQVEKVDFLRRVLHVEKQLVYEAGVGLYFDDLKTDSGLRQVPLTQRAIDLLAAYIARYPPPETGAWAGLVFTTDGGKPIGESSLDWALKNTCRRAGLRPRHWHELRHHYASVLIAGGESPTVVQLRLGHKDVLTTLRIYSHLFAEAEERTRSVLDAAWATPGSKEKGALTKIT